jgi:recombination DNA repair RAD52 pathway protein
METVVDKANQRFGGGGWSSGIQKVDRDFVCPNHVANTL